MEPNRRHFLQAGLIGAGAALAAVPAADPIKPSELEELTLADLRDGMKSGKFTARSLAEKYLARIEAVDKRGPAAMYSPRGLNGDIDMLLYPINYGILYFVGFDVLPPFVAYAVARSTPDQRREYLREYAQRLRTWHTATPLAFRPLEDYDETLQLRADRRP